MHCNDEIKHVCLGCLNNCDTRTLEDHHHCCSRSCEDKYMEISSWERKNFGKSFLESLSMYY